MRIEVVLIPCYAGSGNASALSAALDALQQQGRVKEIPNADERIRAIAKSYIESPEKTLIVSPDNASRRELNVACSPGVEGQWKTGRVTARMLLGISIGETRR